MSSFLLHKEPPQYRTYATSFSSPPTTPHPPNPHISSSSFHCLVASCQSPQHRIICLLLPSPKHNPNPHILSSSFHCLVASCQSPQHRIICLLLPSPKQYQNPHLVVLLPLLSSELSIPTTPHHLPSPSITQTQSKPTHLVVLLPLLSSELLIPPTPHHLPSPSITQTQSKSTHLVVLLPLLSSKLSIPTTPHHLPSPSVTQTQSKPTHLVVLLPLLSSELSMPTMPHHLPSPSVTQTQSKPTILSSFFHWIVRSLVPPIAICPPNCHFLLFHSFTPASSKPTHLVVPHHQGSPSNALREPHCLCLLALYPPTPPAPLGARKPPVMGTVKLVLHSKVGFTQ